MGKVININFRKPPKDKEWICDLSVWSSERGYIGTIADFNDDAAKDEPGALRLLASALEEIAWLARKTALEQDPDPDQEPLATTIVFASSRVSVRVDDDRVQTDEQKGWLRQRFEEGKEAV